MRALASIAVGVAAAGCAWALLGGPGLGADSAGDPGPSPVIPSGQPDPAVVSASPSASSSTPVPTRPPTALDRRLAEVGPPPAGFTTDRTVIEDTPRGLAALCGGGNAPSDRLVVSAVTSTLTGDRGGVQVRILSSRAVYRDGGVAAVVAEAATAGRSGADGCVDGTDPLPGYPRGSVLLRARGSEPIALLVTATGESSVLLVTVTSQDEEAVVDTLFQVVPTLVAQARAQAARLPVTP